MALAKKRNSELSEVRYPAAQVLGVITPADSQGSHPRANPTLTLGSANRSPLPIGRHVEGSINSSQSRRALAPAVTPNRAPAPSDRDAVNAAGGTLFRTQVAKNLILARNSLGVTQDHLAEISGISRATIAQIESGDNDCRLSTLSDLAGALSISPVLLLLRGSDISSLIRFLPHSVVERVLAQLSATQIQEMHAQLQSGLQKNLVRVAQTGAAAAEAAGFTTRGAAVGAGIGSAVTPGIGTAIGTIFGQVLSEHPADRTMHFESGAGI